MYMYMLFFRPNLYLNYWNFFTRQGVGVNRTGPDLLSHAGLGTKQVQHEKHSMAYRQWKDMTLKNKKSN